LPRKTRRTLTKGESVFSVSSVVESFKARLSPGYRFVLFVFFVVNRT